MSYATKRIDKRNKYQRKNMIAKLAYPLVSQYPKAPKTYYTVTGGCTDAVGSTEKIIDDCQQSLEFA